jgi:hypothetical protein
VGSLLVQGKYQEETVRDDYDGNNNNNNNNNNNTFMVLLIQTLEA